MYQHCTIWERFVRRLEGIDCPWHFETSTKLSSQIKLMLLLSMVEVQCGTDCYITKKRFKTSPKPFNSTRKTQFTGIIEPAATETLEGKHLLFYLLYYRFEEALFDFDKAISLEGSNPVIFSNRGLVNRKMERFAAAIQDYSNEIKFSQNINLQALNNRAYCFAKLGQYNEAIVDYTKVL